MRRRRGRTAQAWAHGAEHERAAGGEQTVAEWAETWQGRQLHQRESSRAAIRYKVNGQILPELGHLRLDRVTRADVQDAVAAWQAKGLAPATITQAYRYLAGMMREAVLDGLIPSSPCVKIRLPRVDRGHAEVLTTEQVQQIADTISPWAHDAVLLAAATGMRPSEWRGLTADRIDLQARTILVDRQATDTGHGTAPLKTPASRRTITVGEQTAQILTRLVAGADREGRLFHTGGAPWTRHRLSKVWTTCRGRLPWMGLGGWHQLRHHHASVLLSSGASVVAVARRLGHKDATETLATYAHVMPSDDSALAALTDGLVH